MSDNEYKETRDAFYRDLEKLKDQYNYDSRGHGSINIYDHIFNDKIAAAINWSACGTQDTIHAKAFATALIDAIEACEKFNATHDLDSY